MRACRLLTGLALLLLEAAALGAAVPADDLYLETIADDAVIPQGVVSALAQDSRGLIWIGSQEGLLRYDGYRFQRFGRVPGRSDTLAGEYIVRICVGADGRLWLGTASDGLSALDPISGEVRNFRHDPQRDDSLSPGIIWALACAADGRVLIGTNDGLNTYLPEHDRFVHDRARPDDAAALVDNHVRALLIDRRGDLWLGTQDGLQRRRLGSDAFERVASAGETPDSLAGQTVFRLFEAADGKLWIGLRGGGVAWLDPDTGVLQRRSSAARHGDNRLSHDWIHAIAQPRPEEIWLGTYGGGIDVLAAADGRLLRRVQRTPAVPGTLAHDYIGELLVDRSGLTWIGTWGGGLQRHNPLNQAIRTWRERPGALSHADVSALLERSDGRLLVGSEGNGIDIIDRDAGLVGAYRPAPDGPLPDGHIYALHEDADGTLWIGTQQAGLLRLPPGANSIERYDRDAGLPNAWVRRLLRDRQGRLWVATAGGLAYWAPDARRLIALRDANGRPMTSNIYAMAEDPAGRLWLGSWDGLWLLDIGATTLRRLQHDPDDPHSLANDKVNGLLVDRNGRLWVDTAQGLDRLRALDDRRAEFDHISPLLGRPGLYFGGNLLEDAQGRIWSPRFLLDPDTLQWQPLGRADGLDIGTSWTGAFAKTRDGLLLYGGTRGLAMIDPARFHPWTYAPPLAVTEIQIDGKPVVLPRTSSGLILAPDQRSVRIEFAALDFSAPAMNRYAYRLVGYDSQWITADASHRSASFGGLWPGQYRLEVRGSNRLGQWSDPPLQLPIEVRPAFWQTPPFAGVAALAFIGLLHGGWRWRTRRLQRRARQLQEEVEQRTVELRQALDDLRATQGSLVEKEKMAALGSLVAGVAHEINTPLGVALTASSHLEHAGAEFIRKLSAQALSRRELEDFARMLGTSTQLTLKNLERACRLVESFKQIAVDRASEERGRFELKPYLEQVLLALRAGERAKQLTIELDCPAGIVFDSYPGALLQVITQLVDNAWRHGYGGRSGTVTLRAALLAEQVQFSVVDCGAGMSAQTATRAFEPFFTTQRGQGCVGLGLHSAYNLTTQVLGGSISIHSTEGHGCEVCLLLPRVAPQAG